MRWSAHIIPKNKRRQIKRFAWFPVSIWNPDLHEYIFVWLEKYTVEQEWILNKWETVDLGMTYREEW